MNQPNTNVRLSVREKPSSKASLTFQTEVVPNATYEGRELYERLGEFLNLPYGDHFRAQTIIDGIESFIMRELERGNRLDFGLVSFMPRLSSALPARDANPSESGIFLRGSVKARKRLSASLGRHLTAVNPVAGDSIHILNTLDLYDKKKVDTIQSGHIISVAVMNITIDPKMSDEGIWLEVPLKRRNQKRRVIARAEILASDDPFLIKCRFNDPLPTGKFMLTAGTRAGNGPAYKLRLARMKVRVVG